MMNSLRTDLAAALAADRHARYAPDWTPERSVSTVLRDHTPCDQAERPTGTQGDLLAVGEHGAGPSRRIPSRRIPSTRPP